MVNSEISAIQAFKTSTMAMVTILFFGQRLRAFEIHWLVGGFSHPSEKYATVKLDHETPIFGVKIPKIFELPPPRLERSKLGERSCRSEIKILTSGKSDHCKVMVMP